MADTGIDLLALDDLPNPEELAGGDLGVAVALAHRIMTPPGAMEEIGDPTPYDSIDVRDWLAKRLTAAELRDLETQAEQVVQQDERVQTVTAKATFADRMLSVAVSGTGTDGPFSFVVAVNGVTATLLRGS